MKNTYLKQGGIIKWVGGKRSEIKTIKQFMPIRYRNFIEPFVGGGSVFLSQYQIANNFIINDKSKLLINLYLYIQNQDEEFFNYISNISDTWNNLKNFTLENIEKFLFNNLKKDVLYQYYENFIKRHQNKTNFKNTTIRSAYYNYIRFLYNQELSLNEKAKTALFFFIRNFAYSGMQRFNKKGEFNTPYGGTSYNDKNLSKIINFYKSKELIDVLRKTKIYNLDFQDFFNQISSNLKSEDFIFLDPPYDTTFSNYENEVFNKSSHIRLKETLTKLPKQVKWLMIINNSDFILNLYQEFNIKVYSNNYAINFRGRNNNKTKHLIITNY